jgi:hypothetical protein
MWHTLRIKTYGKKIRFITIVISTLEIYTQIYNLTGEMQ